MKNSRVYLGLSPSLLGLSGFHSLSINLSPSKKGTKVNLIRDSKLIEDTKVEKVDENVDGNVDGNVEVDGNVVDDNNNNNKKNTKKVSKGSKKISKEILKETKLKTPKKVSKVKPLKEKVAKVSSKMKPLKGDIDKVSSKSTPKLVIKSEGVVDPFLSNALKDAPKTDVVIKEEDVELEVEAELEVSKIGVVENPQVLAGVEAENLDVEKQVAVVPQAVAETQEIEAKECEEDKVEEGGEVEDKVEEGAEGEGENEKVEAKVEDDDDDEGKLEEKPEVKVDGLECKSVEALEVEAVEVEVEIAGEEVVGEEAVAAAAAASAEVTAEETSASSEVTAEETTEKEFEEDKKFEGVDLEDGLECGLGLFKNKGKDLEDVTVDVSASEPESDSEPEVFPGVPMVDIPHIVLPKIEAYASDIDPTVPSVFVPEAPDSFSSESSASSASKLEKDAIPSVSSIKGVESKASEYKADDVDPLINASASDVSKSPCLGLVVHNGSCWKTPATPEFEYKSIEYKSVEVLKDRPQDMIEDMDIHGLIFRFSDNCINIRSALAPDFNKTYPLSCYHSDYESIQSIQRELEKVDSKGFVNSTDLSAFPIVGKLLSFLTEDDSYIKGKRVTVSYKWIYNYLCTGLYDLSLSHLSKIDGVELGDSDLKADYSSLTKHLFGKLDPSIRSKLQKRGISITQNVYTGFDTEYKNKDAKHNELLSVQLAVNTKTLLKIPKHDDYELSSLDTIRGKEYKVKEARSPDSLFNYGLVEKSLNSCIKRIRGLKYLENDRSLWILIEGLKHMNIPMIDVGDSYVFSFPRSAAQTFIYYNTDGKGYSLEDLLNQSNKMGGPDLESDRAGLIELLQRISKGLKGDTSWYQAKLESDLDSGVGLRVVDKSHPDGNNVCADKVEEVVEVGKLANLKSRGRSRSRSYMSSFTDDKVSVSHIRNNYVIAHLTNADLCMLNDFAQFKEELSIVNKCFVTLGKPLVVGDNNVIIRDTTLLAPAGKRSLDAIGDLYGDDFRKIRISKEQKSNMDLLLASDKALFESYAKKDAVITLMHSNHMEDFNFGLNGIGVPITLSSLGSRNVLAHWQKVGYGGYQISSQYLLGDASTTQTPKGLSSTTTTGLKMSLYIANYKGGRNESFMYGVDRDTIWYDYDLTSAYTSAMALLGNPSYSRGIIMSATEFINMSDKDLVFSYTTLAVDFKFPPGIKYPSIPCYLDDGITTVYPLEGSGVLSGSEYLVARNQGCEFTIKDIYSIPFETREEDKNGKNVITYPNRPFNGVIKDILKNRSLYPKGSINNLLYKEMGNSVYGAVVRGMGNKKRFDIKSGSTIRMEGSELSNPILASWITSFIRSLIGESLHKIFLLNGKTVSVTTDGFITDIADLEDKLEGGSLLSLFKNIRSELSGDDTGLEVKHVGKGIISWTTRGQLSSGAQLKATTGFQARNYSFNELETVFIDALKSGDKTLEYVQSTLRSATSLYKDGGHVTMEYRDQIFRLQFDNRRSIIVPLELENTVDFSEVLLDSKPVSNSEECKNLRYLSQLHRKRIYNRTSSLLSGNKYKDYTDLAVRNFLKGLLSDPPKYGLHSDGLKYSEIIDFVKGFNPKAKISKESLSNLKSRKMVFRSVPSTRETLKFVEYVKGRYPNFIETDFFSK